MKTTWLLLLVILTLALVSAIPKKRGGGSSKGWGGKSHSHSHSQPDFSGAKRWLGGSKISKVESKVKAKNFKTVKKVALVSAGVYISYKLAKLGAKFGSWRHGGSWGFDDWDDWREADGMLCRTSDDCRWVDQSMRCEDWETRRTGFSSGWFGGVPILAIRGECACPEGKFFDDNDMDCKQIESDGLGNFATIVAAACVVVAIILIFRKLFMS